jgi:4-aminobutyrate aminotransferase-like enzyme
MSLVNTNSRYLHPNATQLCNELSAVLPKHLRKCFIVSSGSEAIDLALRLARCHTGHKHVIALTQAYNGNTTAVMEVSENKFREPYLVKQDWVTIVDNPDCVNGKHATAAGYTSELEAVLQDLKGKFATFIMESIVSVGGGVIPPKGYMSAAFRMVREAGGVCIADETQIGLGRTGNWWAFQADGHPDASPDILVIGKQLGNGFPVSLVVATEEIVRSLERTRIDFFSSDNIWRVNCQLRRSFGNSRGHKRPQSGGASTMHGRFHDQAALTPACTLHAVPRQRHPRSRHVHRNTVQQRCNRTARLRYHVHKIQNFGNFGWPLGRRHDLQACSLLV